MTEVFVVTHGHLCDHTLVGVFSSLAAAKAATGLVENNYAEWRQASPTMLVFPVGAGDRAWAVETVTLDEQLEPVEAAA